MDKTPVSILYNIGMKLGTLPVYTEISATTGTHQNQFTTKVVWRNYSTEGTASSKKEAKQTAAKKMLSLLLSSKESLATILSLAKPKTNITLSEPLNTSIIKSNLNPLSISNAVSSENLIKSITNLSISDSDTKEEFINYVGLLNEYCQQKNLSAPIYKNVAAVGPSHLPLFTVNCTAGSVCEEGSASTKKIAKHQAAKKILEKLQNSTPQSIISNTKTSNPMDNLNVQFMELSIHKVKYDKSEKEKILATYGQLKQEPILIKQHIKIENYVEVLCNLCHNIPMADKNDLGGLCQTGISRDPDFIKTIMQRAFKTSIQEIDFYAAHGKFAIGCKLNTYPVMFQFGIGITREQARINALYKLLEYISLLLK